MDKHPVLARSRAVGSAQELFFFIYADDDGKTYISTFDRITRGMITIRHRHRGGRTLLQLVLPLAEGVLCAILGTKYEARIVWWRFDKLIGNGGGLVK